VTGVLAILRFDRTVADLVRTEAFYRDALGFVRQAPPEPLPPAEAQALGLSGFDGRRLRMALGHQQVSFLALDPPGAPYPTDSDATDPVFQHLAIPVRDMAKAFAQLSAHHHAPISQGGPQVLPLSSGGVAAYKFRDPDGHPLELIHFPGGEPAERWAGAPGLFLGIDHSAITVTDLDAAIGFLGGALGLTVSERGLNRGPEQARLDGLADPVVDVIAMTPPDPAPHVELLHYREPQRTQSTRAFGPADCASTRFVFAVEDPAALAETIALSGFSVRITADETACYASGPDGHGFVFLRQG